MDEVSVKSPDQERASALLKMALLREKSFTLLSDKEFTSLVVEGYYEIIKELITALMSVKGFKTLSHSLLIGFLAKFYPEFSMAELHLIDQLRVMRNDIGYRGKAVNPDFLERNKANIDKILPKLKICLNSSLNNN
ncbi:hypothetical protein ACFL0W_05205 [Nanoarchaeota archaeon]